MINNTNTNNVENIEFEENAIMTNERTTIIKGFVVEINGENIVNKPFEIATAYTRSNTTARKLASKALDIDANFIIVTELVNEPKKEIKYDIAAVMAYSEKLFEASNDDTAEIEAKDYTDCTLVKFVEYHYDAQIWSINNAGEYATRYYLDVSPCKFTKINARGFLRMSFEQASGETVLGIHDDKRREVKMYALVPNKYIAECIEK